MNNSKTLISQVFLHAQLSPNKKAIITDQVTISYGKLKEKIIKVAGYFVESGIKKGDRIILAASSSPSFIFGYFASHLIGAIAVPIDSSLPEIKVNYIIKKTHPKKVIFADRIDSLISISPNVVRKFSFPRINQTADILFTSGTTREPKGVILSHKNIYSAARNINLFIGNNSSDIEVVPLPLSHSFGLGRLRCNLLAGSTIILCNGFLNPLKITDLIRKYNATGFSSVPTGFVILLKLAKDQLAQCSKNLKYIEIGSAPMAIKDKKALINIFPQTRICMHYGLTEASRSLFIEFNSNFQKLDSIGKPTPNVKVKIVDESGRRLPQGAVGQLMIKADTVMQGYLADKKSTKKTLINGWLLTEDLGYMDKEGFFYLTGRKNDLINSGGRKVNPLEIESIMNKHQSILESACIGKEDPMKISGQIIKAFVVLKSKRKPQSAKLIRFLRQYLEEYKIPKEFVWVSSIPKTSSGKIQHRLLK